MKKSLLHLLLCLFFFILIPVSSYSSSLIELLPQKHLTSTLIAVPRQPQIQLGMRYLDDTFDDYDENFQANDSYRVLYGIGTVAVGYPLSLVQFNFPGSLRLQACLEGGIWSIFANRYESSPQLNTDYKIGLPLTLASDRWAMILSLYHISCHAGDELIVSNPTFERINMSREVVDYFLIYNMMRELKLYGGAAVTVHSDRSYRFKDFYVDYGIECRPFNSINSNQMELFMTPFLAINTRNDQQFNWKPNVTVCAGVEFNCFNNANCSLYRLFCEYYHGHSLDGQFREKSTDYFSINISYGF